MLTRSTQDKKPAASTSALNFIFETLIDRVVEDLAAIDQKKTREVIQKKIQIYGGKHANLENVLLELTDPPKIDYYEEPVVLDGQVGRALIGDREAEVVREDFNRDYLYPPYNCWQ